MGFWIKEKQPSRLKEAWKHLLWKYVYHNWKDKEQLNIVLAQRDVQIHETGHIFKLSKFLKWSND